MKWLRCFGCCTIAAVIFSTQSSAQTKSKSTSTDPDIAKLQREIDELRQALIWMIQSEQSRNEMLLRSLNSGKLPSPNVSPPPLPDSSQTPSGADRQGARAAPATATLQGKIVVRGPARQAYVYVEDVSGAPVKTQFEISQQNKRFSPDVAVVRRGTKLIFPNKDMIQHDVFSPRDSANPFTLAPTRSDEAPGSVVLNKPGVVNIFCNIHPKMSAAVLVVPNNLYAKAGSDGTFRINNVPVGRRRVVAWAPDAQLSRQDVEVTSSGAEVSLSLEVSEPRPHLNKAGQQYPSYEN